MKVLYQELKNLQAKPQYFGLGFIQLKVNALERYHFYHPDLLPVVNIEEEVHNHRYDFESEIILGSLTNKIYHFEQSENGLYLLENESCSEIKLTEDQKNKKIGNIELFSTIVYEKGNKYFMDYRTYHTVNTKKCVTKLTRSKYLQETAQVIRPIDSLTICPFSLKLDESVCWDIIKKVIDNK